MADSETVLQFSSVCLYAGNSNLSPFITLFQRRTRSVSMEEAANGKEKSELTL